MEKQEPLLQQRPRSVVWKILATMMKVFLGFLLLGFFLVAINNEAGNGLMLLLWPIAMVALPALFIYLIYSITSKTLTVTGISEKPDDKGHKPFFGNSLTKTLFIVFVVILITLLVMYLNLHKYY